MSTPEFLHCEILPYKKDELHRLLKGYCDKYYGLTFKEIAKLCDMSGNRLNDLLYNEECKGIRAYEMEAFVGLGEKLEKGEVTFTPDRRGKSPLGLEIFEFVRSQLRQLIDAYMLQFERLTVREIERLCQMVRGRLHHMLNDEYCRTMRLQEADVLWELWGKLESGEMQYQKDSRGRRKKHAQAA